MKHAHLEIGKFIIKLSVLISISLFVGCEPYIVLKVINTNLSYTTKSDNYLYIIERDTISVDCLALYPEHDSTSKYIVIVLLTRNENMK